MATPIPDNACEFTLAEIAQATGAQVRIGRHAQVTGITTDSRGDLRGKLFVALEGERFDGHCFAERAARDGAAAVLVQRDDVALPADVSVLRVPKTLDALGALGRAHRRRWGGKLVAVAGSAGKTTTKDAIGAALEACEPGSTLVTPGNLNNRVGVPLVLFGLRPEHRFAVIEVGTNQPGEIAQLAAVCEPDVAVLTLIALEHSECLGDLNAIEAEEGSLLAALSEAGAAVVNADDERCCRQLDASLAGTKRSYGTSRHANYRIVLRAFELERSLVAVERPDGTTLRLETSLLGAAGALAVSAAVAVTEVSIGRSPDEVRLARAFVQPALREPGRLRPCELRDGTVVLDDTYNANPASIRSSLETALGLSRARNARLVLVVGEMRELGAFSEEAHREVGQTLAESAPAALIAICGEARRFTEAALERGVEARFADTAEEALAHALELVLPGDVVLVKASRGVRSERVVEGLIQAKGRAA